MSHIIREMAVRDWESIKNIYNMNLMNRITTFRVYEYVTYVEGDENHLKECGLVVMIMLSEKKDTGAYISLLY